MVHDTETPNNLVTNLTQKVVIQHTTFAQIWSVCDAIVNFFMATDMVTV